MESYSVRVAGDDLVFSAAHFVTLAGDTCERLHGHDYRVTAEVIGPIAAGGFVVDFIVLRDTVKRILAEWDHRVLLAEGHRSIRLHLGPEEVEATHASRRWVFPREDCAILPVPATTTEHLAGHLARRLVREMQTLAGIRPSRVHIELAEAGGLAATCNVRPD